MAYPLAPGLQITRNKVRGNTSINIFGRNNQVGITFEPITPGGVLQLPEPANAQALRIAAGGNADDAADGPGARQVLISGLDATGRRAAEVVATAGASASSLTETEFWRVQEVIVLSVGTYGTGPGPTANAGDITIEDAGGNVWATVGANRGRSQIAAYTVPVGYSLSILDIGVSSPPDGRLDVIGMARGEATQVNGLNRSFLTFFEKQDIAEATEFLLPAPIGPFIELTDIVFFAKVANSTSPCAVSWDGVLTLGIDDVDLNGVTAEDFVIP